MTNLLPSLISLSLVLALLPSCSSLNKKPPPPELPRISFEEMNPGEDQAIDKAEFESALRRRFFLLDLNRDGEISIDEEGGEFHREIHLDADLNGNGRLTPLEYLDQWNYVFDREDANRDGKLSLDEFRNLKPSL